MSEVAVRWQEEHSPLRNTSHDHLKFLNTLVFSEEARHFLKYGYYTNAPFGSKDFHDYWNEQEERVMHGYSVGGVRIPGRYYYFLNFSRMKARPVDPNTGRESSDRKIITFPRFLDHQYYFFHELEECFAEGPFLGQPMKGMCIFKSRRKGMTYVIACGVFNYNFNFVPASMSVLAAYEKSFYKVTLDGIHFTLNHTNRYTDWAKRRDKLDKRDHFRASFISKNDLGMDIEDGYMSEIRAISFKDDPFKSIGESTFCIGYEEAGQFPDLLTAFTIAEPTYRDGNILTGIPLIWGSAGNEVASADLEELFYNPEPYGLKAYQNIYDENATGDCGWFIDDLWYHPGTYKEFPLVDSQGNSFRELADKALEEKREQRRRGSKTAYNKFITQQPRTPAEGFLRAEGTIFDTIAAKSRLAEIITNPRMYLDDILLVYMEMGESGNPYWVLDTEHPPLRDFPLKDNKNKPGVIEIYSLPQRDSEGLVVPLRYIGGIDSYDDDASDTLSVGSLQILDRFTDRIVAHYKGRPDTKTFYEQCRRLLMFYGATANYERKNKGIYGHFYNKNSLHLLCDEPEILREKGISRSNIIGNNSKGTNPVTPVKNYGNTLMVSYLESPAQGEESQEITHMMRLRSVSLLKEITYWSPDERKNYDDVDSLRMLMIYRENLLRYEVQKQTKGYTPAADPYWARMRRMTRGVPSRVISSGDFQPKRGAFGGHFRR